MPPRRKEPTKSPKGKQATKPVPQSLPNGKRAALEEELDSGASSGDEDALGEEEEPEEPSETADERRVRLAKDLLAGMDAAVESSTRESRIRDGDDAVADQLEEEALPQVEIKVAQASASWLSGGYYQRQLMPQAARSSGQPRSISRLCRAGRPYRPCFRHRRCERAASGIRSSHPRWQAARSSPTACASCGGRS